MMVVLPVAPSGEVVAPPPAWSPPPPPQPAKTSSALNAKTHTYGEFTFDHWIFTPF